MEEAPKVECPTCFRPMSLSAGLCFNCGEALPANLYYEDMCAYAAN